jgi:linoleoyl-CoA desaturase
MWEVIEKHNRVADCWVVVDNGVYDLTDWIPRHPGGAMLGVLAGEDVSAFFHTSHLRDVRPVLEGYRIGHVADPRPSLHWDDSFLPTLKKRVGRHFADNGIAYGKTREAWLQLWVSLLGFAACWCSVYLAGWWPLAVPMGLISCALVGGLAHEYCHGLMACCKEPKAAPAVAWSVIWAIVFPFMLEKHFQYEHLKHHTLPLDETVDYEVFALRRFLRLAPSVPWRPYMRFQHRYAFLVYAFYITVQVIGGFVGTYFDRRCLSRDPAYTVQIWAMPLVSLAAHVALPVLLVGWTWWLPVFVLYNAVWQMSTYFVAAVVHLTDASTFDSDSWPLQVCHRTANVLCGNPFYDWLSGGFNYQIEHHLLPSVAREHLSSIAPIVRSTCEEFGVPYRVYRSLSSYLAAHYEYLVALSRPEGPL